MDRAVRLDFPTLPQSTLGLSLEVCDANEWER